MFLVLSKVVGKLYNLSYAFVVILPIQIDRKNWFIMAVISFLFKYFMLCFLTYME